MRGFYGKGLSLVEMMISLATGSVLILGVIQLYGANADTYRLVMGGSRMQESAMFALDFIGRDIRRAGYRGCAPAGEPAWWIADPGALPYEYDLLLGVQGYDAAGGDSWSPSLDDVSDRHEGSVADFGIPKEDIVPGTDVLTLRHVVQQDLEIKLVEAMATANEPMRVYAPVNGAAGLGFDEQRLVFISDCEKAAIVRITDIAEVANAPQITLGHDPGLAVGGGFEAGSVVAGIETHVYYIAQGAGHNLSGDAPLSLWQKSGASRPMELVEGIEDLQVLFGVSTDGDRTPDQYVTADAVTDWRGVTIIQVTVVANSVDDVGGVSTPTHTCDVQACYEGELSDGIDGLMRRTFMQAVMLRNYMKNHVRNNKG